MRDISMHGIQNVQPAFCGRVAFAAALGVVLALLPPALSAQEQQAPREQQERQAQDEQRTQEEQGQRQQQPQTAQQRENQREVSLELPPQQGLLRITAAVPEQIDVRETFQYEIRVENATKNVMLRDVTIKQEVPSGLAIQSVEGLTGESSSASNNQPSPPARDQKPAEQQPEQQTSDQQSAQNQNDLGQQAQAQREQQQEQGSEQSAARQQRQRQQSPANQQAMDGNFVIDQLEPGESRTIRVTASADEAGEVPMCLALTSYTPSLCFATRVVSRELQLVKRSPESATLCQPIELEYFVQNDGTAAIEKFTVRDDLGEGLLTESGKNQLEFAVDGLAAGDTRKFVATVYASQPGTVSSAAVAILPDGKEVRTRELSTEIQPVELAVAIDGPQTQQFGERSTYTVRVTNRSQFDVPEVAVTIQHPQNVRLLRVGQPREGGQPAQSLAANDDRQPTPVAEQPEQGEQRQDQPPQTREGGEQRDRAVQIGDLKADETRSFTFTATGDEPGVADFRAIATAVCGAGEARAEVQSVATVQTEIIALPALAIDIADEQDPVSVNDEVVYAIAVLNEGQATDNNIQVSVDLPEELEFVAAEGATESKHDGGQVQFQPVEQLEAGKQVTWKVRTKAANAGETALRVNVKSDTFEKSTSAEEPTRLLQASGQGDSQPQEDRQQGEQKNEAESSSQQGGNENAEAESSEASSANPPAESQD